MDDDEVIATTGAILGGRRWYDASIRRYDGPQGIYGGAWKGPIFLLTHRPPQAPDPAVTFVTDGIASAVATAQAAHEKDVLFSAPTPPNRSSPPGSSTRFSFT
jgi:hypothetical protein